MRTSSFIIAVATGMTLTASAFAAGGMRSDRPTTQQLPQQSQPGQTGAGATAMTGADFDREVASVARSLQRSAAQDISTSGSQGTGVAGSPGQVMGRGGQLTDSGSAGFDSYVDQVNRQLQMSAPAAE